MVAAPPGFEEFVAFRSTRLLRAAYQLTHDWALAEDLTQAALAKAWRAWSRLSGVEVNTAEFWDYSGGGSSFDIEPDIPNGPHLRAGDVVTITITPQYVKARGSLLWRRASSNSHRRRPYCRHAVAEISDGHHARIGQQPADPVHLAAWHRATGVCVIGDHRSHLLPAAVYTGRQRRDGH
jgi:hypothetical protein